MDACFASTEEAEYGKARRQGCGGNGRGIVEAPELLRSTVDEVKACGLATDVSLREGNPGAGGLELGCHTPAALTVAIAECHILINNAGIRKYEKVDEASWNEILSVNLISYVFCAKAAVPLMHRNTGGASLTSPPCVPL